MDDGWGYLYDETETTMLKNQGLSRQPPGFLRCQRLHGFRGMAPPVPGL